MKSTSGDHFIALDHVRAVATFMVFVWHFAHSHTGNPVSFEFVPSIFFLSLLDEGHTGVALFMTLSGYLFAKLLDGKNIKWTSFYWNRFLRLFPLLFLVIIVFGFRKITDTANSDEYLPNTYKYITNIVKGVYLPTLPNGGWSITVELHFYLLLPWLLFVQKRARYFLTTVIMAALLFRYYYFTQNAEVFSLSYWTIVGRIDQFVCGIIAFKYRSFLSGRHFFALVLLLSFSAFYWIFNSLGGYQNVLEDVRTKFVWVFLPTIEGIAYAMLIAYYDNSFKLKNRGFSRLLSAAGEYSYSIYLLHVFIVFWLARFINENLIDISNFYLAVLLAIPCFLLMCLIGHLSFRFIESPFLKYRRPYIIDDKKYALS